MKHKNIFIKSSLALAIAGVSLSANVFAVDAKTTNAIEEVIVTADKTEKSIQDTSIAVSVVTGDFIAENGMTKIDDILKNEASVTVQGAARGFLVSIRGLGLSLPPQMGQGAVSTNYDGAFSSRAESASSGFFDLDRVEVLRGPQSTLYGRNSVGGVVNIISKDPTFDSVNGYVTAEAGSYSLKHLEGALNTPINDKMALRVAVSNVDRDGFISNGHDDNVAHAERVKFLYQPNETTRLLLGFEGGHLRGKGPGAVPVASIDAGTRDTTDVGFGYQETDTLKYWANFSTDIGPGTLKVLPSYLVTEGVTLGAFGGNFNWAADPKKTTQKQLEVNYSAPMESGGEWNLGFYHYNSENQMQTIAGICQDVAGNYVIPNIGYNSVPPGPPGPAAEGACLSVSDAVLASYEVEIRTSKTDGVFGQMTLPLSDTVNLIVGGRYSWEEIGGANDDNANFVGDLPTLKDEHFDFRLGLEARVLKDSMIYATAATGYRQGGFGFSQVFPEYAAQPYEPEEMTNYEIGMKNSFMDGALLLNATAFYYDYDSFQLVIADFSSFPPAFSVPTMPATQAGLELEWIMAVGDTGKFNGSYVYSDSELEGKGGFYVGLPFPNAPETQLKLGYEFSLETTSMTITPRVDWRYASSSLVFPEPFPVTAGHPSLQDSYTMTDASVRFGFKNNEQFSVLAYVKNAGDEMVKQSHFFGYAQLQAPRTYGVTATYNF